MSLDCQPGGLASVFRRMGSFFAAVVVVLAALACFRLALEILAAAAELIASLVGLGIFLFVAAAILLVLAGGR